METAQPLSIVQPAEGSRPLGGVQRAYFYLVALVGVHMVVLAVANLLRVAIEIAFHAPPGGFTGLPFIFADLNQPNEVYRQQASLAVALLVVGLPVWLIHFGYAQRIARQRPEDRASAWRSFHIHLVIFVTALLVFGYGQRALRLVLQGIFLGGSSLPSYFGIESEWGARAAGAAAMVIAAAAALAYHVRISSGDRRATLVAGRAASLRQLVLYSLALIGLFGAAIAAISTLGPIWDYVTQRVVPVRGIDLTPNSADMLKFQLLETVPGLLAGVTLWLATWIPLQRGVRASTADAEVERRSGLRALAIYLVVLVSAVAVLAGTVFVLASVGRRLLGDPIVEQFSSLQREIGTPLVTVIVFGVIWIFYRRVVSAEAAREARLERAANIRRVYTYLIAAIGLAMIAIGAAGTLGVLGSMGMGINTHSHGETATYIALLLVGAPSWGFAWFQVVRGLSDDERRSLPRRTYLYLVIGGSVIALLVFVSAILYRLLNATLAGSFGLGLWHDVWHLTVDAGVSAGAFLFHLGALRGDRRAQVTAAPEPTEHSVTVLVRALDAATARARVASALGAQADITVR